MSDWQEARLIPVSGIGSESEAETRGTSALLAVMSIVRPFSKALLDSMGASRARGATVDTYIEVDFENDGGRVRPDGVIQVSYGNQAPWVALVEVKTGSSKLEAQQINNYWHVARKEKYDAVITISNEIALAAGEHPTRGLKVRANSSVQVHHLSWTYILSEALSQKIHRGVEDPEQSWMLGELIRYLEHPNSGALEFNDMGPSWVEVRKAARERTLGTNDPGAVDVADRWEQLLRYAALTLGADIGEDVRSVHRGRKRDPVKRVAGLANQLAGRGHLAGALRVPNTAGDIELIADLRARQVTASMKFTAPEDKGAVGRVSWLVRQLGDVDVPDDVTIEAWVKNGRAPAAIATLAEAREDRSILTTNDKSGPDRFKVVLRQEMAPGRRAGGKSGGFIDSVLGLVDRFYVNVVQEVVPWQRKASRKQEPPPSPGASVPPVPSGEHDPLLGNSTETRGNPAGQD